MFQNRTTRTWSRGLQHASDTLIRRGTAMGPLVPMLLLVPVFLTCAYLFQRNIWVSLIFVISAIGIVIEYFRQFSKFARDDPDRLQSESYRYAMQKIQLVSAKELPGPVPIDDLHIGDPISNPINPMPALESIASYEGEKK